MKPMLTNFLRYNQWANQKICKYLAGVDDVAGENSSTKNELFAIKNIILHIADGEQTWLSRLNGDNVPHMHQLDLNGSFASICNLIHKNSQLFIEFIHEKRDSFFLESTEYINLKGVKFSQNNAEIILHCMNHSTFHRGQVINMLRHVGYTDQSASDFIMFLRAQEAESSIES